MKTLIEMAMRRAKPGTGSSQEITLPFFGMNFRSVLSCPFAIVGGQATRLYMPERMTLDWNLMIHKDHEASARTDLEANGAVDFRPLAIPGFSCQLPDGVPVDVLVFDDPWVALALSDTVSNESGDPVLNLPWLILLKLKSSRVQDLADISRMLANATQEMADRCRDVVTRWDPASIEDFDSLLALGRREMEH